MSQWKMLLLPKAIMGEVSLGETSVGELSVWTPGSGHNYWGPGNPYM